LLEEGESEGETEGEKREGCQKSSIGSCVMSSLALLLVILLLVVDVAAVVVVGHETSKIGEDGLVWA
jgi:hypothetical protein